MNPSELRSTLALSSIFALRMLGLFLILPIFSLHAKSLPHGDNTTLVGLTIGMYGFVQAFLHIPLGILSDRYGRKLIVAIGLSLFVLGSLVAASHDDLYWIIAGRAIQGAGAISAAITAWIADLTREEVRTRAMALIGASIALSFAISLVIAGPLYALLGMPGIFMMMAILGALALLVAVRIVPSVNKNHPQQSSSEESSTWHGLIEVLKNPRLIQLNLGILVLHSSQVAMFIVIPRIMQSDGLDLSHHWMMYLIVLVLSIICMAPLLVKGEKANRLALLLKAGICMLILAQIGFAGLIQTSTSSVYWLGAFLVVYFTGFNLLESLLPSLVSRSSGNYRGAGLGVYNTLMSIGLFIGGILGGWIYGRFGSQAVFIANMLFLASWCLVILKMPEFPRKEKATQS